MRSKTINHKETKIKQKNICENKIIETKRNEKADSFFKDISKINTSLSDLLQNDDIEEIMINSITNAFIFSRKSGSKRIDIALSSSDLDELVKLIISCCKRDFEKRDFIDGVLPDGSRVNVVSKNISEEYVITIRKFLKTKLTIIDLILSNALTPNMAAYIWTIVEGLKIKPSNLFVCGGTGTGKTSLLNIILDFVNSTDRLVVIEDTRELDLSLFENSVSLVSDISNPESLANITINTLRMRPDRIIVGEVRGKEAQSLFAAMDTGHDGCMATLHSNNSADVITKLLSKPMEIPEVNIDLLDVIIILKRDIKDNKIRRYISQITEVTRIGNINLNDVYSSKENEDIRIMSSSVLENYCELTNITKSQIKKVIEYRSNILQKICDSQKEGKRYTASELKSVLFNDLKYSYQQILGIN